MAKANDQTRSGQQTIPANDLIAHSIVSTLLAINKGNFPWSWTLHPPFSCIFFPEVRYNARPGHFYQKWACNVFVELLFSEFVFCDVAASLSLNLPCRGSRCWSQTSGRSWSRRSCSSPPAAQAPGTCWSLRSSSPPRRQMSHSWCPAGCCWAAPRRSAWRGCRWGEAEAASPNSSAESERESEQEWEMRNNGKVTTRLQWASQGNRELYVSPVRIFSNSPVWLGHSNCFCLISRKVLVTKKTYEQPNHQQPFIYFSVFIFYFFSNSCSCSALTISLPFHQHKQLEIPCHI